MTIDKKMRFLTVSSAFVNNRQIPQIRIQGKWLNDLGFLDFENKEQQTVHAYRNPDYS